MGNPCSYFYYFELLLVQNVANIWPLDNQNYFLTFEHNYLKTLLSEVWRNWAFQEIQPFYVAKCRKQIQKKIIWIYTYGRRWIQIYLFCIGKGQLHWIKPEFEWYWVVQRLLVTFCSIFFTKTLQTGTQI